MVVSSCSKLSLPQSFFFSQVYYSYMILFFRSVPFRQYKMYEGTVGKSARPGQVSLEAERVRERTSTFSALLGSRKRRTSIRFHSTISPCYLYFCSYYRLRKRASRTLCSLFTVYTLCQLSKAHTDYDDDTQESPSRLSQNALHSLRSTTMYTNVWGTFLSLHAKLLSLPDPNKHRSQ